MCFRGTKAPFLAVSPAATTVKPRMPGEKPISPPASEAFSTCNGGAERPGGWRSARDQGAHSLSLVTHTHPDPAGGRGHHEVDQHAEPCDA